MALTEDSLTKFFEILAASKLPSELSELFNPTASHFLVIQTGSNDAQKVSVANIRGSKGAYNANTNTPNLYNGIGVEGDFYIVSNAGTRDFGNGSIVLSVDDVITYLEGKWRKTGYAVKRQTIIDLLGFEPENPANKGQANGYVPLNGSTKIDTVYLPAYVEEIVEGTYVNTTTFNDSQGTPVSPSANTLYLDTTTSEVYRWGGTQYVNIVASPGTTTQVPEGTNLYFTNARVFAATLSGLVLENTEIVDGDSVITAFGKLQGQINDLVTSIASFADEVQAYDSQDTGVEGVIYLDSANDKLYQWKNGAYVSVGGGSSEVHTESSYTWNTGDPQTFTVTDSAKTTDIYVNGKRLSKNLEVGGADEWQVNNATTIEILVTLSDGDKVDIVSSATAAGGSTYDDTALSQRVTDLENVPNVISYALSSPTADLATGDTDSFVAPYDFTLNTYFAGVAVAPTGSALVIGLKKNGTSVTSSDAIIDANETTSLTGTAPVLTTTSFLKGELITPAISQVGSLETGKSLKIYLEITKS